MAKSYKEIWVCGKSIKLNQTFRRPIEIGGTWEAQHYCHSMVEWEDWFVKAEQENKKSNIEIGMLSPREQNQSVAKVRLKLPSLLAFTHAGNTKSIEIKDMIDHYGCPQSTTSHGLSCKWVFKFNDPHQHHEQLEGWETAFIFSIIFKKRREKISKKI